MPIENIPKISAITFPLLSALRNGAQRTMDELEDEVGRISFGLTKKEREIEKASGGEFCSIID